MCLSFVAAFAKENTAEKAGIKKDDQIIALDGVPTPFFNDFTEQVKGKAGKPVNVTLVRNEKDTMDLPATVGKDGKLGMAYLFDLEKFGFTVEKDHYTFLNPYQGVLIYAGKPWATILPA